MHRRVSISLGGLRLSATLTHSPAATALWELLPVQGTVQASQGEVRLALPAPLAEAEVRREEMALGEMAYLAEAQVLELFYGATPASLGREPRAEVAVSPVGMLEQSPEVLATLQGGEPVRLERRQQDEAAVPAQKDVSPES